MAPRPRTPLLALLVALALGPAGHPGELLRALREEPRAPEIRGHLKVSTSWLAPHREDEGLVILHVGPDRQVYDRGHVPGARFVAVDRIVDTRRGIPNELPHLQDLTELARELGLHAEDRVVVYDEQRGLHAARLFFTLESLGFLDRVAMLDGGLERWRDEGRPLERVAPRPPRSRFVPDPRPEVVADLRLMQDLVWLARAGGRSPLRIVDARPKEHYTGAIGHPRVSRLGHVPGARSAPWEEALRGLSDPRLLPDTRLRALQAPDLPEGSSVVTYCNTGMQAAFSYYVMRYLGYDVRLYDGSMAEWTAQPDTAVIESPWPSGM